MACIKSEANCVKASGKRSADTMGETSDQLCGERAAKRGCGPTCDSPQQERMDEAPSAASCCSPVDPNSAPRPPSATPTISCEPDTELQGLLPFLSASEIRVLAQLEMPARVVRGECQRCGGRGLKAREADGVDPPCICRVVTEDQHFREARANLARQVREVARQRRAAHMAVNCGADVMGCTSPQNRLEPGDGRGTNWDWLTQMNTCMPPITAPPAQQPFPTQTSPMSPAPPPPSPQQPSLPPQSFTIGPSFSDATLPPGRDGFGRMAQMPQQGQLGTRPPFMPPRPDSSAPPPSWGFSSGSTHAMAGGQFGAQAQPGGAGGFGPQSSFHQIGFGQSQPPPAQQTYMQGACPLPSSQGGPGTGQSGAQPGGSGGFGISFRQEGTPSPQYLSHMGQDQGCNSPGGGAFSMQPFSQQQPPSMGYQPFQSTTCPQMQMMAQAAQYPSPCMYGNQPQPMPQQWCYQPCMNNPFPGYAAAPYCPLMVTGAQVH